MQPGRPANPPLRDSCWLSVNVRVGSGVDVANGAAKIVQRLVHGIACWLAVLAATLQRGVHLTVDSASEFIERVLAVSGMQNLMDRAADGNT